MKLMDLFKISQADRNKFCEEIIDSSAPTVGYYFLIILSTLIVAMGILADNIILVIGGMMVTPLLSPILALALSVIIVKPKVILRSLRVLFMSLFFVFIIAFMVGLITSAEIMKIDLINLMEPSLAAFIIAIVAGLAASFTWAKQEYNSSLPGVAVTVTLIPPLTAAGIAAADREWPILYNLLDVLLINLAGILLASLFIFFSMKFYRSKKKVLAEIKEEEKELKK